MVFADASSESVILQYVLQGGALALLAIIVWQIPSIFKLLREWRQDADAKHIAERKELLEERKEQLKAFREEIRAERDDSSHKLMRIVESHESTITNLNATIQALNDKVSVIQHRNDN